MNKIEEMVRNGTEEDDIVEAVELGAVYGAATLQEALRTGANHLTVDNYLAKNPRRNHLEKVLIPWAKKKGYTEIAKYFEKTMLKGCETPEGLDEVEIHGVIQRFDPVAKIARLKKDVKWLVFKDRERQWDSGQLLGPFKRLEDIPFGVRVLPETIVDRRSELKPEKLPRCCLDLSRKIDEDPSPNARFTREQTRVTTPGAKDLATICLGFQAAAVSDLHNGFAQHPAAKGWLPFQAKAVVNPETDELMGWVVDLTLLFGKSNGVQLFQAWHALLLLWANDVTNGEILYEEAEKQEKFGLKPKEVTLDTTAYKYNDEHELVPIIEDAEWASNRDKVWKNWRAGGNADWLDHPTVMWTSVLLTVDDVVLPANATKEMGAIERGNRKLWQLTNKGYDPAGVPYDPLTFHEKRGKLTARADEAEKSKTRECRKQYEALGYRVDHEAKTLEIAPDKVKKYDERIKEIETSGMASIRDLTEIVGKLGFMTRQCHIH